MHAWQQAAEVSPHEVRARVAWFLAHTNQANPKQRLGRVPVVVASFAAALLATVFVLVPEDPGSRYSNIWAAAAWSMIAVSVILTLTAARMPFVEDLNSMMRRAMNLAEALDSQQDREGKLTTV